MQEIKRREFNPWVRKISWRRDRLSTAVYLPGESHGQRNLVGYSPWVCKESDTTDLTDSRHPRLKLIKINNNNNYNDRIC